MTKQTQKQLLDSYQVLTNWQKDKIAVLEAKIKDFEAMQAAKCCECERGAVQESIDAHLKLQCFNDSYFNNLTYEQIAELAKKSIRMTTDNCNLEDKLERIKEVIESTESAEDACKVILSMIRG